VSFDARRPGNTPKGCDVAGGTAMPFVEGRRKIS
jgi:hypothetical protein